MCEECNKPYLVEFPLLKLIVCESFSEGVLGKSSETRSSVLSFQCYVPPYTRLGVQDLSTPTSPPHGPHLCPRRPSPPRISTVRVMSNTDRSSHLDRASLSVLKTCRICHSWSLLSNPQPRASPFLRDDSSDLRWNVLEVVHCFGLDTRCSG